MYPSLLWDARLNSPLHPSPQKWKLLNIVNNITMLDLKEYAKYVANSMGNVTKEQLIGMYDYATQEKFSPLLSDGANNIENLSWLRTGFGENITNNLSALGSILNWLPWVLDILWYIFLIYTWLVRGTSLTMFFFVAKEWICIEPTSAMLVLKFVIGCIHMMQKFIRPLLLSCILMVFAHPCYSFVVIITFYFLTRKFCSFFGLHDYNKQIKYEAQIEVEKKMLIRLEKAVKSLEILIATTTETYKKKNLYFPHLSQI